MSTADQFDQLTDRPVGSWWSLEARAQVEGRPVRIARDPQGRPTLLVPATERAAGERLATRGLVARIGALAQGETYEDWLIVTCREEHLDSTFVMLVDDVLADLRSDEKKDPVLVALATVERWQKLLASLGHQMMSEPQAAGLLAELHLLEILAEAKGVQVAKEAWVGHDGARVDFRFADAGIEVKATTSRDRFKVSVHGLLQLDPTGVGRLGLWAEQFERVPSGGDSVPAAKDRLVARGFARGDLEEAMVRSGYRPIDEAALREVQFTQIDTRAVEVRETTPRIVAASFADGSVPAHVAGLEYSLDLTDLTDAQGLLDGIEDLMGIIE